MKLLLLLLLVITIESLRCCLRCWRRVVVDVDAVVAVDVAVDAAGVADEVVAAAVAGDYTSQATVDNTAVVPPTNPIVSGRSKSSPVGSRPLTPGRSDEDSSIELSRVLPLLVPVLLEWEWWCALLVVLAVVVVVSIADGSEGPVTRALYVFSSRDRNGWTTACGCCCCSGAKGFCCCWWCSFCGWRCVCWSRGSLRSSVLFTDTEG